MISITGKLEYCPKHPGNPKPRIITGKRKNYNDKEHILQVMRQQREDKNSSLPFYITPQTPSKLTKTRKNSRILTINTGLRRS